MIVDLNALFCEHGVYLRDACDSCVAEGQPTTNPERAPSQCAVEIPESGLRARITVRKDGVVTKRVEVRLPNVHAHRIDGSESAVCRPAPEADDAA